MHALIRRFHSVLVAIAALALSAGLVFASPPPPASTGLANAGAHSGRTVPVAGGAVNASEDEDEDTAEDEDAGEDQDEDAADDQDQDAGEDQDQDVEGAEDQDVEGAEDTETDAADAAGDHCTTDPTALTPEQLDAMNHGSIVCWAAHQTEWPAWFLNHGAFVSCWAHQGKADAASCTEDPTAEGAAPVAEKAEKADKADKAGKGGGHGKAKAKGRSKHVE